MTWEGLFVILALQFRSLLKILDLLRENESMHSVYIGEPKEIFG